ncbi:MAG: gamma-glutamylcyclotransferase family protein [Nibricoccus sp.]
MKHQVFVYGTLKHGGSNHHLMAGQQFIAIAKTEPLYKLYSIGAYPGMVDVPTNGNPIEGEIWAVDADCLAKLDRLEGLDEGLYKRVPIRLQPPNNVSMVEGYLYLPSIAGRRDCGTYWPV